MKQISSRLTAISVPSLTRFVFGTLLLYTQFGKPAWRGDGHAPHFEFRTAELPSKIVASNEWRWAFREVTDPDDDVAETIRAIAGAPAASTGT